MKIETFDILFGRHLDSLKEEILSYKDEKNLWKLEGGISNPPGNLALHLCGNLKHNIGAVIGKTGYVRKRDEEFSKKNVSREDLVNEIESAKKMIVPVLKDLTNDDLAKVFESDQFNEGDTKVTNGWVLARLGFHFGYHLGQINYHRRLLGY